MLFTGFPTCQQVSAQLIDTDDENWVYRYDIFQAFLQREGLVPVAPISVALESPKDSTIVLMGEVRRESVGAWIKLKEFVDLGGRILLAPDNFHSTVYFGETQTGPARARLENQSFRVLMIASEWLALGAIIHWFRI